jgi:hypothetical protein
MVERPDDGAVIAHPGSKRSVKITSITCRHLLLLVCTVSSPSTKIFTAVAG